MLKKGKMYRVDPIIAEGLPGHFEYFYGVYRGCHRYDGNTLIFQFDCATEIKELESHTFTINVEQARVGLTWYSQWNDSGEMDWPEIDREVIEGIVDEALSAHGIQVMGIKWSFLD